MTANAIGLTLLRCIALAACAPARPPLVDAPEASPTMTGLPIGEFCDFRDGAALSQKCRGFIAGVADLVSSDNVAASGRRAHPATCVPYGLDVEEVYDKLRPHMQALNCAGKCTATSDVLGALAKAYPADSGCVHPTSPRRITENHG